MLGSLAIAYRQGNDAPPSPSPSRRGRVDHVVADTLRLIDILSDPANRAPLEAELALAAAWYQEQEANEPVASYLLPSVPDTPQPPWVVPHGPREGEGGQRQPQPELPWHDDDDAPREFPFTTTCFLSGLLRDDTTNSTRPGDVQLQPLSTVFRGDCCEYGLVVLDISDLDRGVTYGIVAFPVSYMAEVWYFNVANWEPVEDPLPGKEPDVVLISPRPRVPLSILQWLDKYFYYSGAKEDVNVLRLEEKPLVDAGALDYIWPVEFEDQPEPEDQDQATASSPGVFSSISDYFWPSKSTTTTTRAKDDESPTTAEHLTMPQEHEPRNVHMDRAIDNLLILTQDADLHLDKTTIGKFQQLAEFREQLRQRLEEVPGKLGPSSEALRDRSSPFLAGRVFRLPTEASVLTRY